MELTFLVDNNALVGSPCLAEAGLSMFIEADGRRVLFDTGYSDAFLVNARRKGVDLLRLDWIALSHGHFDHTWGLGMLLRQYCESGVRDIPRPGLLAHPKALVTKRYRGIPEFGPLLSREKLESYFDLTLSDQPVRLSDSLVGLGEIERVMDFEQSATLGERLEDGAFVPDDIPDDTALAYVSDTGLVVIAGCAHSGICNTVEQARRVTGVDRVRAVLGGFHLQNAGPERLGPTADYLAALNLEGLWCCHCTDLAAKIALAAKCPVKEVGSGLTLAF
ncbi:MBL fold metallo-hydrolase [Desulfovibrio sp. Huiquan2017]|uniref:MBL fold metallo-hydrolase n=1 Tax=Desulfovibrio sp. Huiquan2017 TaxID=2816861 RepID=UPI001A92E737|nr:MBL fold metallo-hydrolase [Desulfovibrio sp. Huiquan2017]